MKKLLALAFLCTAVMSFAGIDSGLEAGQTRVGIYGGMSMPQDWSYGGVSVPPGDTGLIFGGEMLHNITPVLALGLEVGYANYGKQETKLVGVPLWDVKSNVFSVHALGRLNFMPEKSGRLYIPFGVGISRLSSTFNDLFSGTGSDTENQTGFSCLAGLGFEFDLDPIWTVGLEGRYFYMPLDKDKFVGDSSFSSLNILLKIGARF